ncbi:unnamed protein product [Colias eurytheme]|nr:unnamed protein product [Colias eurytheme]
MAPPNSTKKILEDFIEIYRKKLREIEPDANKEVVVKKINNLRSNIRKEKKKYDQSLKSGASADDVYCIKLWYYDLFNFIHDQCTPRESSSNLDSDDENSCEASETESKGNVTSPDISASTSSTQIINTEICDKEGPALEIVHSPRSRKCPYKTQPVVNEEISTSNVQTCDIPPEAKKGDDDNADVLATSQKNPSIQGQKRRAFNPPELQEASRKMNADTTRHKTHT